MANGQDVLKTIEYVRDFYRQVSLLLQDADRLMGERGWECSHGSRAIHGETGSLQSTQKWIPDVVFRFYVSSEEHPHTLAHISILVSDLESKFRNFTEPRLSAGFWAWDSTVSAERIRNRKGLWDYHWARTNGFNDPLHNGDVCAQPRETWSAEDQAADPHFLGEWSFGYPLVQFGSAEDLGRAIVVPLLKLIDEVETAHSKRSAD